MKPCHIVLHENNTLSYDIHQQCIQMAYSLNDAAQENRVPREATHEAQNTLFGCYWKEEKI